VKAEVTWTNTYTRDCSPNFSENLELARHRWYGFKEGFSSSLVKRAIVDTRQDENTVLSVLDPFSGSGTTPLTALENGCKAQAIEVNPFLSFVGVTKCITKTKTSAYLIEKMNLLLEETPLEISSPLEGVSTFSPGQNKSKWLFNSSVLRGYQSLLEKIEAIENNDDQRVFLLALYTSAMKCCNARKDGKCLRYKKGWELLGYNSSTLREEFVNNCLKMIEDLERVPLLNCEIESSNTDSRTALKEASSNSIDLVVFSPPYLNSFDYSDIYRPELFLANYVGSNEELRVLREKTLRSHVQYSWKQHDIPDSLWVKNIVSLLEKRRENLWDKLIPEMVGSYFYDMESIFRELYRIAKNGSGLWFVVSTSAYAEVEIAVDLILADLATQQGWELMSINALRKLRSSSQSSKGIRLRESLVICRK